MPNTKASSLASTYTTTMKVNAEGRPYAKDLFDLFAALAIQLKLGDHRAFFRTYPSTFTTDDAAACLKNLKFTHIIRIPDPSGQGYQSTRTTTTFSMERAMAKHLLQHFIHARLMVNPVEPDNPAVKDKNLWAVTSKGRYVIEDFSARAYVAIDHLSVHLASIQAYPLVLLDRIAGTDQLAFDRRNITNCFMTMMSKLPTERILADDVGGLKHHHSPELYEHTFYGNQCFDWIVHYTSVVSKEEADMVAGELVLYGWIAHVVDKSDSSNQGISDDLVLFRTSRHALYNVTERGRQVLGWHADHHGGSSGSSAKSIQSSSSSQNDLFQAKPHTKPNVLGSGASTNSFTPIYSSQPGSIGSGDTDVLTNTTSSAEETTQLQRLRQVLQDPLLRMYFRLYLKDNFCDENMNFWLDYYAMRKKRKMEHTKAGMKELLSDSYAIYDSYLKTGASMEVNIDHTMRQNIDELMRSVFSVVSDRTTASAPFTSPVPQPMSSTALAVNLPLADCLHKIMQLFDQVNDQVCRMMAQDSIPRFLRTEKYKHVFAAHLPAER
ncbi:regulator of G protein signaling superfamily [Hesseltinella vesiculosa]|uniref:Regulator of G protein signaling superfamily n=1 Tax=Hesseltinella vesiculosa TaxID=101127 RepID=A0A1X2GV75_9FUNG|nr:regulator of G protein signaling superfamily [Hesseltinella vesiculosa]